MKIIEALKKIKELQKKAEDIRGKIGGNCDILNFETAVYPDTKRQIKEWLQAHGDLLKEVLRLRLAIQKTNINTEVEIELNGKAVKKTIAEGIHRRRDLAGFELGSWKKLTDRGLKEGQVKQSTGEIMELRIVRFYDPVERDKHLEELTSEPMTIDARLEIVNAVTDLME